MHGHLGHGHLVKIETDEENEELYNEGVRLNMTGPAQAPWIGLNDIAEERNWVWTDGTRVNFTNWSADQPDNANHFNPEGEDCAVLNTYTTGETWHQPKKWNDAPCNTGQAAICELNV